MTTTPTLREAAERLMHRSIADRKELARNGGGCYDEDEDPLIVSLRAALAEQAGPMCQCGHRPASQCAEPWEPDCDLGNNEKYVQVADAPDREALRKANEAQVPLSTQYRREQVAKQMGSIYKAFAEKEASMRPTNLRDLKNRFDNVIRAHCGFPAKFQSNIYDRFIIDYGLDSLDLVVLIMGFEDEFDIEISTEKVGAIATVDQALKVVCDLTNTEVITGVLTVEEAMLGHSVSHAPNRFSQQHLLGNTHDKGMEPKSESGLSPTFKSSSELGDKPQAVPILTSTDYWDDPNLMALNAELDLSMEKIEKFGRAVQELAAKKWGLTLTTPITKPRKTWYKSFEA